MIRPAVLILAVSAICAAAEAPLRILILSGQNTHEWRTSTPMLRHMLESTGRFECKVTEEPSALTAGILGRYDAIVTDHDGPRLGPVAEKAIESFVRAGKGLAVVHAAPVPFGTREARVPSSGKRQVIEVRLTGRNHPVVQGLAESFFVSDIADHAAVMRQKSSVLGESGQREPLLLTYEAGKGRIFQTALGHDPVALSAPGFIQTFTRGVEWAATGKVTIAPDAGLLRAHNKDAVNVLVVTGGHDYDPSFDGLFEGEPRIRANVDPHPVALTRELRKRYDVVVFYDMAKTLGAKEKQNLLNFAEAGKGILIMHHALVNYPGEQWWRDIAGAQYIEGKSTYVHDREFIATPAADHPVLDSVPEMYLHDETYKGMWFADTNKVLLTTKDSTADGPLVWVSAYPKSRVIGIQPGHNRESHNHPGYRRLVHNAILWAAGRK